MAVGVLVAIVSIAMTIAVAGEAERRPPALCFLSRSAYSVLAREPNPDRSAISSYLATQRTRERVGERPPILPIFPPFHVAPWCCWVFLCCFFVVPSLFVDFNRRLSAFIGGPSLFFSPSRFVLPLSISDFRLSVNFHRQSAEILSFPDWHQSL